MEIITETKSTMVPMSIIEYGEVFLYRGTHYIKVNGIDKEDVDLDVDVNCISMSDWKCHHIRTSSLVVSFKSKLVIGDIRDEADHFNDRR